MDGIKVINNKGHPAFVFISYGAVKEIRFHGRGLLMTIYFFLDGWFRRINGKIIKRFIQ